MTPVLELADVSKVYEGNPPIRALDGVNLTVHPGELVGVVGASGSGKSTLLNVVGTLARPSSGTVRLVGQDLGSAPDRALSGLRADQVGFVFQQFHLIPGISATDNVAAGLLYRGTSRKHRRHAAAEVLARVGLGHRREHRPHQLSGGERQRVAIARAVVGDPALILADEPTGNLDSHASKGIVQLLQDLNRTGATIIVITHDRSIAAQFPRCVEMTDGRITSDKTPATPLGPR